MDSSLTLPTTNMTKGTDDVSTVWVCPEFKVSGLFASHMVLQREMPIRIWGFSRKIGSEVAGQFMGELVKATVGEDNRWELVFSPRTYCTEGQVMVISDEFGHTVVMDDILIGDVWMIGGQSNAEMHLSSCMTLTPSVEFYEHDNFRFLMQAQHYVLSNKHFCDFPNPDLINSDWTWKLPDRESSLRFSAIGWYFAKEIIKHTDIPLGFIGMAAGGACLRELMPVELAHSLGYTSGGNVREAGYYNALIHPTIPLSFKAMIFFQGESEGCWKHCADAFDVDLKAFFADARKRYGHSFSVYNIQLSDYGDNCFKHFPWLDIARVKQFDALSIVPDMTLTVDMDLGAPADHTDWAHSPRKLELAERLARLALAKEYCVGSIHDAVSPRPISATLSPDGSEITVSFTDIGSGLTVSGQDPKWSLDCEVLGFTVGPYEDRREAKAVLSSRGTVTVKVPDGADTRFVNYAFSIRVTPDNANLYNGNNLPCPAFSIKVM